MKPESVTNIKNLRNQDGETPGKASDKHVQIST